MILSVNRAKEAVELFKSFRVDGIMIFEEGGETQLSDDTGLTIPILSYGVSGEHTHPIIDVNHKKQFTKPLRICINLATKTLATSATFPLPISVRLKKKKGLKRL